MITESDADALLTRWGAWSKHSIDNGYAKENILYRMIREAGGAGHVTVRGGIAMSKDVERVESIVSKFSKTIKKAVKMKYIANLPDYQAAKKCRCYEDDFVKRINYAIDIVCMEMQ